MEKYLKEMALANNFDEKELLQKVTKVFDDLRDYNDFDDVFDFYNFVSYVIETLSFILKPQKLDLDLFLDVVFDLTRLFSNYHDDSIVSDKIKEYHSIYKHLERRYNRESGFKNDLFVVHLTILSVDNLLNGE